MYACRCSDDSATVNADSLHRMPAGVLSKCLSCHDARCFDCTNPLNTPCRKGSNSRHTHLHKYISSRIRIAKIADNDYSNLDEFAFAHMCPAGFEIIAATMLISNNDNKARLCGYVWAYMCVCVYMHPFTLCFVGRKWCFDRELRFIGRTLLPWRQCAESASLKGVPLFIGLLLIVTKSCGLVTPLRTRRLCDSMGWLVCMSIEQHERFCWCEVRWGTDFLVNALNIFIIALIDISTTFNYSKALSSSLYYAKKCFLKRKPQVMS